MLDKGKLLISGLTEDVQTDRPTTSHLHGNGFEGGSEDTLAIRAFLTPRLNAFRVNGPRQRRRDTPRFKVPTDHPAAEEELYSRTLHPEA